MRIAAGVARSVAESLRESLPTSERTAGIWLSGFVWAMVLHWAFLILTTWLWMTAR